MVVILKAVQRLSPGFLRISAVLTLVVPSALQSQSLPWIRLGANGVVLYTFADPVPRDRSLGEVRLTQPAVMVHGGALSERVRLLATLNLEGLTIPDG